MVPLVALSIAIFVAQTAEFLPGGMTPQISEGLGVDLALAGQLVSVFALTVVLTAAPLALATRRLPRKPIIVTTFALVCLANIGVALGPTFEWLIAGRIAGAMAHGLFWSVVAAYIAEISPPERLGQAVGITAAGGSLSGILGFPLGNALGQYLGWRVGFLALSAAGLTVVVLLLRCLPAVTPAGRPAVRSATPRRRARLSLSGSGIGMTVVCGLILITVIGQTAFGPFTTAWLESIAGFERGEIPLYLLVTGCAGAIGVMVAGRMYDRWPRASFTAAGLLLAASMALFPLSATSVSAVPLYAAAIVVSLAFAGMPSMLQTRMMQTVPPHRRAVAGAVQTTAFNVGIGGGAVVGGALTATVGLAVLPCFAAVVAVLAVVASLAWDAVQRRFTRPHSAARSTSPVAPGSMRA